MSLDALRGASLPLVGVESNGSKLGGDELGAGAGSYDASRVGGGLRQPCRMSKDVIDSLASYCVHTVRRGWLADNIEHRQQQAAQQTGNNKQQRQHNGSNSSNSNNVRGTRKAGTYGTHDLDKPIYIHRVNSQMELVYRNLLRTEKLLSTCVYRYL